MAGTPKLRFIFGSNTSLGGFGNESNLFVRHFDPAKYHNMRYNSSRDEPI